MCCVAETREMGRGGRADLALALTSLHHTTLQGMTKGLWGKSHQKEASEAR